MATTPNSQTTKSNSFKSFRWTCSTAAALKGCETSTSNQIIHMGSLTEGLVLASCSSVCTVGCSNKEAWTQPHTRSINICKIGPFTEFDNGSLVCPLRRQWSCSWQKWLSIGRSRKRHPVDGGQPACGIRHSWGAFKISGPHVQTRKNRRVAVWLSGILF